eukprot:CAMPEP_0167804388 /NCGR_PEP_ID=MMETSP0111_2-20121227/20448_1 /TAXON_ID=91324 /ORGANISM="Lotharella globosa, Strain CCCM811" /LENGTH=226 /DNA_ID=CAMNT_0007701131 /DNA_START=75 /DNA_END=752 /DNA_ORIENTATION=-
MRPQRHPDEVVVGRSEVSGVGLVRAVVPVARHDDVPRDRVAQRVLQPPHLAGLADHVLVARHDHHPGASARERLAQGVSVRLDEGLVLALVRQHGSDVARPVVRRRGGVVPHAGDAAEDEGRGDELRSEREPVEHEVPDPFGGGVAVVVPGLRYRSGLEPLADSVRQCRGQQEQLAHLLGPLAGKVRRHRPSQRVPDKIKPAALAEESIQDPEKMHDEVPAHRVAR